MACLGWFGPYKEMYQHISWTTSTAFFKVNKYLKNMMLCYSMIKITKDDVFFNLRMEWSLQVWVMQITAFPDKQNKFYINYLSILQVFNVCTTAYFIRSIRCSNLIDTLSLNLFPVWGNYQLKKYLKLRSSGVIRHSHFYLVIRNIISIIIHYQI